MKPLQEVIEGLPEEDREEVETRARELITEEMATRDCTERGGGVGPSRLRELLQLTRGCWDHGDGLRYQNVTRDEWTWRW